MAGVRNLRAMFEQKGDFNLPDRGRSPGPGGFASPSPTASPRPLSTIRTSFIAVEKDGKLGMWREQHSGDSASASSRPSDETGTTTPHPLSERSEASANGLATNIISKMNLAESTPTSPQLDNQSKSSPKKELKGPLLQQTGNTDKASEGEDSQAAKMPSNPTESSPARPGDAPNGTSSNKSAAAASSAKPTSKTAAPASTTRAASRGTKTPVAMKASTAKDSTKAHNAKEPSKAHNVKEPTKTATSPKKVNATKPVASKPAPVDLTQSGTSSVKPKTKSPTRPAKLPSSLTTHTASSAQKLGSGSAPPTGRSLSRASVSTRHLSPPSTNSHRAPSRNSVSTLSSTTAKAIKHQASSVVNAGRARSSIGPPPKPAVADQSGKKEGHVDEGFLARMMRPTQSSAKKSSDKTPSSPPRKSTTQVKKPEAKDVVEKTVKKVVTKTQLPATKGKTSVDGAKSGAAKEQPKAKAATAARPETPKPTLKGTGQSSDMANVPAVEDKKTESAVPSAEDATAVVKSEETIKADVEATSPTDSMPTDVAYSEVSDATESKATGSDDVNEYLAMVANAEEMVEETQESSETIESQPEETIETIAISTEELKADAQEPVKQAESAPLDVASESGVTGEVSQEAPAAAQ